MNAPALPKTRMNVDEFLAWSKRQPDDRYELVNGEIVATAEGFSPRGKKNLNWSAMIPPLAYHDGRNVLELYRIDGPRRLERLGAAP